jgi:putative ABC transport system ATP-binding protein
MCAFWTAWTWTSVQARSWTSRARPDQASPRCFALWLGSCPAPQALSHLMVHQRSAVALVAQRPTLVAGSVRESLLLPWSFGVRRHAEVPSEDLLVEGLLRLGVEVVLDRDASRLSVGQVARIAFLRTLLTAPRVLLLDEPDAALDDASADVVSALTAEFAESGGAVVRVRHHRPDGLSARRMRLEHGSLFAEEVPA